MRFAKHEYIGFSHCFDCAWLALSERDSRITTIETQLAAEKARADGKPSGIPCSDCAGDVVEFTVPNDIWNSVMRPDGKEGDREYLCVSCWYLWLRKHMHTEKARADKAEKERDAHNESRQLQIRTQQEWNERHDDDLAELLVRHGWSTYGVDKKPIRQMLREHPWDQVLSGILWHNQHQAARAERLAAECKNVRLHERWQREPGFCGSPAGLPSWAKHSAEQWVRCINAARAEVDAHKDLEKP